MATTMQQQQRSPSSSSPGGGGGGGGVGVNLVGGGWKLQSDQPHDFSINHPKYTNISPGISSPSSPSHGVLGVGQIGTTSYGSVLMEKSFRNTKPIQQFFKEAATAHHEAPEIETLPLFPIHAGEDIPGFCIEVSNPDHPSSGYNHPPTGGYNFFRPPHDYDKGGSAPTSLELTLNSYTPISPDTD
ncbi:hypothetical protein BVC80_8873g7 [Macleaya cordata]|uniref:Uncharacterized protein n=1 Tax=Macleaya cordata TaxID=56857 RepID=A0A200Q381_MACCD|nr:hypothetical protein BVC80_8873g7 [Macleaya cordata]